MENATIGDMTPTKPLSFIPPEIVAQYAEEGLRLRKEFGRGGTMVGVARARDLKNRRPVSVRTIQRMYSFFARHEVDKRGMRYADPKRPSNGLIAWLLWGGDPAKAWVQEIRNTLLEEGIIRGKKTP